MPPMNLDISVKKKKIPSLKMSGCKTAAEAQGGDTARWLFTAVPVGLCLQNWGTLSN